MQIEQMSATFGRLNGSQLDLQPGLNVICAPNESGKSTWCRFLQNMLYGVPTKERGLLADKNRYAPWSGSPMQGRLLLRNGDARYTLLRETRRATAPMGDAHLTYTGTADPVPGIPAAEAGQYLLGIPREVFLRSAFIGQNALAVDQDAELERRIAALISTGEEDTSYSESYERLKKQLNARRANRSTGQIPALEQEIAQLEDALKIEGRAKSAYYAAIVTGAYRHVIDDVAQGRPADPVWRDEVEHVSHRHYSTGFFYGPPGQYYENSRYIRDWQICAVVTGCTPEGLATLSLRNKFRTGDTVEVVGPDTRPFSLTVPEMTDADGLPLFEPKTPQMTFTMPLPRPVPPMSFIRHSVDLSGK